MIPKSNSLLVDLEVSTAKIFQKYQSKAHHENISYFFTKFFNFQTF